MRSRKIKKGPRSPEAAAVMEASAAPNDIVNDKTDESDQAPRIVRSHRYRIKPLSAEDAVLELEGSNDDVLVFRDSETDGVHVVYRQKDGNFALVEPEF
jgi:putative sigma-54 modulation protein